MSPHDPSPPLFAEEELREALAPFAPDGDHFVGEARRRIAEAGDDPDAEVETGPSADEEQRSVAWRSPFLRRAAALLPLGLLTKGALPGAEVAVPKLGWKGLAAVLSLPAVSVVMLLFTFLSALGALRRTVDGDALDPREARVEINLWWWGHWWQALLCLIGFAVLLRLHPVAAVVLVFVVSMVTLVVILRHLDRYGVVSSASVGRFAGGLLLATAVGATLIHEPSAQLWSGHWQHLGTVLVLWSGAAFCLLSGREAVPWTWGERIRVGAATALLLLFALSIPGLRRPSLERCVEVAEGFAAEELGHRDWNEWGRLARSLREVVARRGGQLDLSAQAASFEAATDDLCAKPALAEAAFRAGLLPSEALERLGGSPEALRLRDPERRLSVGLPAAALVEALQRRELLDESRREQLARLALEDWPDPREFDCLEKMLQRVELLELLGHAPLIEARRSEVEEALRELWTGDLDESSPLATFTSRVDPDGPSRFPRRHVGSADAALQLMLRYGAPGEIDLARFARWLDEHAAPEKLLDALFQRADLEGNLLAADFHLLGAWLEDEGRPLPARLLALRQVADPLLLGAILLTALCIQATVSAARNRRRAAAERARNAREVEGSGVRPGSRKQ